MLLPALKLQLAALVTVAGINTDDVKAPLKGRLESIAADQKAVAEAQAKLANAKTDDERTAARNEGQKLVAKAQENTSKFPAELKEMAAGGNADALYAVAKLTLGGQYGQVSANELLSAYRAAAKAGSTVAQAELGELLLNQFSSVKENVVEGLKSIKDAEAAGNASARRMLAQIKLQGLPVVDEEANVDQAIALLNKGASEKDGAASFALSQIVTGGLKQGDKEIRKADPAAGLKLLEDAVAQGNQQAMTALAQRYFVGDADNGPVKKDPAKGITLLEKAAAENNPIALRTLGQIAEGGIPEYPEAKVDIKKALDYYQKAAGANDGPALLWLGNVAQNGLVEDPKAKEIKVLVQPDPKTALDLYRVAANNNVPAALYNVGLFYENGAVVDKDLAKAFTLYQRAALGGQPQAMFKTAQYYEQGAGTARDAIAARGWYQAAADSGVAQASYVMANVKAQQGQAAAATADFERAASGGIGEAHLALARIFNSDLPDTAGVKKDPAKAYSHAAIVLDAAKKSKEEADKSKIEANIAQADKLVQDLTTFVESLKISAADKAAGQKIIDDAKAKATAPAAPVAP